MKIGVKQSKVLFLFENNCWHINQQEVEGRLPTWKICKAFKMVFDSKLANTYNNYRDALEGNFNHTLASDNQLTLDHLTIF